MTPGEEVKILISKHVALLPKKERSAVIKVFFEGKTLYGAAKELKITRHTLKYRLEKAKNMLRNSITGDIGEERIKKLLREM